MRKTCLLLTLLSWTPSVSLALAQAGSPTQNIDKERELELWKAVKDSNSPALLEDFLKQFPQGTFAAVARDLLARVPGAPSPPVPATAKKVDSVLAIPNGGSEALSLLRQVQEAVGGAENLAAVRSLEHIEEAQATSAMGRSKPQKRTERWCVSGVDRRDLPSSIEYVDTTSGWVYSKGYYWEPRNPATHMESVDFQQWARLLLADTLPNYQVTLARANVLSIGDGRGNAILLEVDPVTHLPAAKTSTSLDGVTTRYSDWREAGRIRLPFQAVSSSEGVTRKYVTLSWRVNSNFDCTGLNQRPAGAKKAKVPPAEPVTEAEAARPGLSGDTSARAAEFLKQLRTKLGGDAALLNVRDYERSFRQFVPTPDGKMQKGRKTVDKGCVTGEFYEKTSVPLRPDYEVFFDGKAAGWTARGGKTTRLSPSQLELMRQSVFNYDIFNLLLADRMPNRQLAMVDEMTLLITDVSGNESRITVDGSGMPVKRVSRFLSSKGLSPAVDERLSDWRQVKGVLLPYRTDAYRGTLLNRHVDVEEWKINTGVNCSELGAKHP